MHVGFDASALEAQTTGAGEYQRNLLHALVHLDRDMRITLYMPRALTPWQLHRVVTREMPWAAGDRVARIFRGAFVWRRRCTADGIDLLHVPIYYLPPGVPTKTVLTVYDVRFVRFPETYPKSRLAFLKVAVPWSLRRANHIIAISRFTKAEMVEAFGIPPEKISVTPLAARPGFQPLGDSPLLADIRSRYQLPERFVLFVGAIEPRKNLIRLVQAFRLLERSGLPHRLVLAGSSYFEGDSLHETVDRLGLREAVHTIGYLPDTHLPALYNLADVLVYPSLYEGFGIPLLEAMACGTPVVASNVSAIPEVVGSAGILVDPLDVDALATAMSDVLLDSALAERLRSAGFERAKEFTWARTASATFDVYQRVISGDLR